MNARDQARLTPLSFEGAVQQAVTYALAVMNDTESSTHRRDRMCQYLLTLPLPTIRYRGSKLSKQEAAEAIAATSNDMFAPRRMPSVQSTDIDILSVLDRAS